MAEDESDVYRNLQQHLDSMPVGFPATESGVEIRILKQLFTPEEARLATKLRFSVYPSDSLDDIIQRMGSLEISREDLETTLDTMVSKGLLLYRKEETKKN